MGNRGAGAGGRASQFRRGEGRAQKSRKNKKIVLTNRTSRDSIGKRSGMTAKMKNARVVELADSLDSGSSVHYARAGSSPASRTKKKDTTFVVSFFLGAAPFGISMACRSKPSLRNCLVLRTCEFTAHQRRRSEDRSDISIAQILTVPFTSEQVLYRLLRLIL